MRYTAILDKAACKGADLAVFFPIGEQDESYNAARHICGGCSVQSACLQYAVETGQDYGMWGGTTPAQRRRIRYGPGLVEKWGVGHGDLGGTTTGYYREKAAGLPHCDECRAAYNESARVRRQRREGKTA